MISSKQPVSEELPSSLRHALRELLARSESPGEFYRLLLQALAADHGGDPLVEQLERFFALATVGEPVRQLFHDVRNLLGAMLNTLEFAKHSLPGIVRGARAVDYRTVSQFLQAVDDVRKIAKSCIELTVRTDAITPGTKGTESADLVEMVELARRVAERALERRAVIRVEGVTPSTNLFVAAPAWRVFQVLFNLLENARQAMEDPRTAGRRPNLRGEIEFSIWNTDEYAFVRVADQGPGVPPELSSRIFSLFFTTKRSGSGIGLHNCRQIVEGWGGTIELEPCAPDQPSGAAFVFSVPLLAQ